MNRIASLAAGTVTAALAGATIAAIAGSQGLFGIGESNEASAEPPAPTDAWVEEAPTEASPWEPTYDATTPEPQVYYVDRPPIVVTRRIEVPAEPRQEAESQATEPTRTETPDAATSPTPDAGTPPPDAPPPGGDITFTGPIVDPTVAPADNGTSRQPGPVAGEPTSAASQAPVATDDVQGDDSHEDDDSGDDDHDEDEFEDEDEDEEEHGQEDEHEDSDDGEGR